MLVVLQIAAVVAIAIYFIHWQRSARRRNSQSWESLLAKTSPRVERA